MDLIKYSLFYIQNCISSKFNGVFSFSFQRNKDRMPSISLLSFFLPFFALLQFFFLFYTEKEMYCTKCTINTRKENLLASFECVCLLKRILLHFYENKKNKKQSGYVKKSIHFSLRVSLVMLLVFLSIVFFFFLNGAQVLYVEIERIKSEIE